MLNRVIRKKYHFPIIITIASLPLIIFFFKFSKFTISNNPDDWYKFYSIIYSFFTLLATISIAYFAHKFSQRTLIFPYHNEMNIIMNDLLTKAKEDLKEAATEPPSKVSQLIHLLCGSLNVLPTSFALVLTQKDQVTITNTALKLSAKSMEIFTNNSFNKTDITDIIETIDELESYFLKKYNILENA